MNLLNNGEQDKGKLAASFYGQLSRQISIDEQQPSQTQASLDEPLVMQASNSMHGSVGFLYKNQQRLAESLRQSSLAWNRPKKSMPQLGRAYNSNPAGNKRVKTVTIASMGTATMVDFANDADMQQASPVTSAAP